MRSRGSRITGPATALAGMLVAAAALAGCVPMLACPAIGYGSVAHIVLEDPRPGLVLELCDGAGCVPGPVSEPEAAPVELTPVETLPADDTATGHPVDTGIVSLAGDSTNGWSASLMGGQPTLGYRLTDAAGETVTEGEVAADWVRIDGTEQCGGNREARITLPG